MLIAKRLCPDLTLGSWDPQAWVLSCWLHGGGGLLFRLCLPVTRDCESGVAGQGLWRALQPSDACLYSPTEKLTLLTIVPFLVYGEPLACLSISKQAAAQECFEKDSFLPC